MSAAVSERAWDRARRDVWRLEATLQARHDEVERLAKATALARERLEATRSELTAARIDATAASDAYARARRE